MKHNSELNWHDPKCKGGIAALSDEERAHTTEFFCAYSKLNTLPENINMLYNLKELYCNDNLLTSLEPLQHLSQLKILLCFHNRLTSLEPLKQLTALIKLDCYCNQLTSLEAVRHLTNLIELNCYGNQLTSLDPLQHLTKLTKINVNNNRISRLPAFFRTFSNLSELDLRQNEFPKLQKGDFNCFVRGPQEVLKLVVDVLNYQQINDQRPWVVQVDERSRDLFILSAFGHGFASADVSVQSLSLLLATGNFDSFVASHFEEVLSKMVKESSMLSRCILHELVDVIPWTEMHRMREVIKLENAKVSASQFQAAIDQTDTAASRFSLKKAIDYGTRLRSIEAECVERKSSSEVLKRCEVRQKTRRETLNVLLEQITAGFEYLSSLKHEEQLLRAHSEMVALFEETNGDLPLPGELLRISGQVDSAKELLYQTATEILQLRHVGLEQEAAAKKDELVILQRELLVLVSEELLSTKTILRDLDAAKAAMVTRCQNRLAFVQGAREKTVLALEIIGDQADGLRKCLDAEGRKAEVERAAKAAEEALKESKEELELQELLLKRKKGSVEELEKAKNHIGECRRAYEEALRQLLEMRALGYPELHCSAASKRDQFPNVPEIDADKLEVVRELGQGSFSDVYEAMLPLTGRVAFKQLRVKEGRDELLNEAAAMWEVRHSDHVVQLLKVCTGKRIGLVMEFMEGGTLAQRLKREALDKRQILEIWRDVLLGVADIHESKQVHMDLKSDNILLDGKGRAKVGDFGTCKQQKQTMRATKVIGTLRWLAPELLSLLQQPFPACDVWSVGMILYELVTRREPYHELDESQVVAAIAGAKEPSIPVQCDKDFVSWMRMCWQRDATKRPTARQLLAEVEKALTRNCGVCFQDFPIGKGVLCTGEQQHFRCNGCLDDEMGSSDCQRVDGAIACNCGGAFDLAHTRLVVQDATFKQWQRKVLAFKEQELERHHKLELERERKRWQEEDNISRLVRMIEAMLTTACPLCKVAFVYDGGCMAIQCPACKGRFCSFCFQTFQAHEGGPCHDHAARCEFNSLPNRSIFPTPGQEQKQFEAIQIARIKCSVEETLQQLSEEQRAAVLSRVDVLLRQRRIEIVEKRRRKQ